MALSDPPSKPPSRRPPPPGAPPSSPASTPADALPFEQLLHHADVLAAITGVLRRYGFHPQDLEDGRHTVIVMALEWKGDRPTTLHGVKALCIVVAHRHGASVFRRKKKHEELGHAGLTDQEDERIVPTDTLYDAIDRKKLLAVLDQSVPEHIREMFEDVAEGFKQPEIAANRGLPYEKVRDGLEKGRTKYRNAILFAGLGTLIAAGAAWLFYVRGQVGPPREEAHPTPSAPPLQVLVQEEDPSVRNRAQAAELRKNAAALCAARRYLECSDTLDDAEALDPDGEQAEAVAALRKTLASEMRSKPNPGSKVPRPPKKTPAPTQR